MSGETKSCPRCATDIPVAAVVCRHCGHEFDDKSEASLISRWVTTHPTLTLSLATFLYVTFQIYKAADFEVNTAVELIRDGGLTAVLVGVFLVQLQYELMLITIVACFWLTAAADSSTPRGLAGISWSPARLRSDERILPKALLVVILTLSFWTVPWPFFVLMTAATAWAWWLADRGHGRRPRIWTGVHVAAALLFVGLLLARPTIWVPAETIVTTNRGTLVGYVVSSGDGWITILTPSWTGHLGSRNSDLIREPAQDVVSRQPCAIDFVEARLFDKVERLRPAQVVSAIAHRALPPTLTPPCAS